MKRKSSKKYTKDEIEGLAFKEVAKREEAKLSKTQRKVEKIKSTQAKDWGSNREKTGVKKL